MTIDLKAKKKYNKKDRQKKIVYKSQVRHWSHGIYLKKGDDF